MNKNIFIVSIIAVVITCVMVACINLFDKNKSENTKYSMPETGQKIWTYDMTKRKWHSYSSKSDDGHAKEYIVLQYEDPSVNRGYSTYHIFTTNAQVPKEVLWLGETSKEFLVAGKLYSYFPKNFEFYEVKFNGVKFVPYLLSKNEISKIFDDYNIVQVSQLKKGKLVLKNSGKYLLYNDIGEDFYKYYIIPNESKKLQMGEFSNQFEVKESKTSWEFNAMMKRYLLIK